MSALNPYELLPSDDLVRLIRGLSLDEGAKMPRTDLLASFTAEQVFKERSKEIARSSPGQKSLHSVLRDSGRSASEIVHIQLEKMLEAAALWKVYLPQEASGGRKQQLIWAVKNWRVLQASIEEKRYPKEIASFRTFLSEVLQKVPQINLPPFPGGDPSKQIVTQWRKNSWALLRPYLSSVTSLAFFREIEILPIEVGDLTELSDLYFDGVNLQEVPEAIGKCQKLRKLNFVRNQLQTIPQSIGLLSQLQELTLSSNQLKQIPKTIFSLPNLQRLEMRDNKIAHLPHEVKWVPTSVHLENNPLENASRILEQFADKLNMVSIVSLHLENLNAITREEKQFIIKWMSGLCSPNTLELKKWTIEIIINNLRKSNENPQFKIDFMKKITNGNPPRYAFEQLYLEWMLSEGLSKADSLQNKLRILGQITRVRILENVCTEWYFRELYPRTSVTEKLSFLDIGYEFKNQFLSSRGQGGLDLCFLLHRVERLLVVKPPVNEALILEKVNEQFLDTLVKMPELLELAGQDQQFMEKLEAHPSDWGTRRHTLLKEWYQEQMRQA